MNAIEIEADIATRTHLAAHLLAPGRVEVRPTPLPAPGPGEVLLRIDRALMGGTDRKAFLRGHPQIPMPGPFGHRFAGSVAALGPGAPRLDLGQPIMGVHSAPCLVCDLCRRQRHHLCPHVMREKTLGAFGQHLLIPANVARQNLFTRPRTLSAEQAALLEPVACVVHALNAIDWRGVETVLVLGLGAVGLLFGQLLPHYTRAARIGAGRRPERVRMARGWGMNPVYDLSLAPLTDQLQRDDGFDVVLECTGMLEGWQEAFARTAPGGQVLLFGGLPRDTVFPVDSYRVHYEEVRILGSFHFAPRDVAQARDFLMTGAVDSTGLISDTLPLGRVAEGLARLAAGEGIQYAVDPWA